MIYDELADLIEKYKLDLALDAVQECINRKLIDQRHFNENAKNFEPSFTVIARCIRSGDLTGWRKFIQQTMQVNTKLGIDRDGTIAIGEVLINGIKRQIDQQWSGDVNESARQKLYNRLDNLHAMAQMTAAMSKLEQAN
jgi:hypothetical protein